MNSPNGILISYEPIIRFRADWKWTAIVLASGKHIRIE